MISILRLTCQILWKWKINTTKKRQEEQVWYLDVKDKETERILRVCRKRLHWGLITTNKLEEVSSFIKRESKNRMIIGTGQKEYERKDSKFTNFDLKSFLCS